MGESLRAIAHDIRERYLPQAQESFRERWTEFREGVSLWTRHRRAELWRVGAEQEALLGRLRDLDEGDRERIGTQVAAAGRSLEIRSSWSRTVVGLFSFFPALSLWLFILYTVMVGWVVVGWVGDGAPGINRLVVFAATLVLVGIAALVHAVVRWLFGVAGRSLLRVVTVVGLASMGRNPGWWQEPLDRWRHSSFGERLGGLSGLELDGSVINAFGWSATVFSFFVLADLVLFAAVFLGPREPRRDLVCAVLVDRLLAITVTLEHLTSQEQPERQPDAPARPGHSDDQQDDEDGDEADDFGSRVTTGLRVHIAGPGRGLVKELEELAQFVEGRWRRAMHSGDHTGDMEINRIADGIAAQIRRWKPTAAIGGPGLEAMRAAFTAAVVNAADEDWRLMAAEVSGRELLGRIVIRWLRRLAAATVLFGTWAVLLTKPFPWVVTAHESGLAPVLYVLAVAVATTLDPVVHDRVVGAIRQAGDIKNKTS